MKGTIASVLTELFGTPAQEPDARSGGPDWFRWRGPGEDRDSRLCRDPALGVMSADGLPEMLRECYGDFTGGFLMGDGISMASIGAQSISGLYTLEELREELRGSIAERPNLHYFLAADNVWFYGVQGSRLLEYDSELQELSDLGELREALKKLLPLWLGT